MALLTLCAGLNGRMHLPQASASWSALGLPQILAGESDLPADPLRILWPEIATTSRDAPRLDELLRFAAGQARTEWLLLIAADAVLSEPMVQTLVQLCRPGSPKRLVLGRAWRLGAAAAKASATLAEQIQLAGVLDSPDQFAWGLLPRGTFLAGPPTLSCEPQVAAPWLMAQAHHLGWPILDATAAAPMVCLSQPEPPRALQLPDRPIVQPTDVVRPHRAGEPLLSLLLAAPQVDLERCRQQLLPVASLPWELIARPAEPSDGPGAVAAAWTSALAVARGELAWPITASLPPLALLPVVLRSFELPGVELLQLGQSPAPGGVVAPRAWWRLLGGWRENLAADDAMASALQQARARGACLHRLPFNPHPRTAAAVATRA